MVTEREGDRRNGLGLQQRDAKYGSSQKQERGIIFFSRLNPKPFHSFHCSICLSSCKIIGMALTRHLRKILPSSPKSLPFSQQVLEQCHRPQNPNSILAGLIQSNALGISRTSHTRTYMSEMRKSAFQDKMLRLLRNEIQYELDHFPPKQPVTSFGPFILVDKPGEQWIRLKRTFSADEDIKVEASMFDAAIPAPKSSGVDSKENVQLHITMVVNISKPGDDDVLEIMCSAWPDTIEITKVFIRSTKNMPAKPYVGPDFKELDDELQDSLYEFLEARGIGDEIAVFLHEYVKNKGKTEYIRWMDTVKSYMEKS
ncbi:unnamed protein product [Linum trigynum]|uniref:Mitochondrial glycoprotein family protein n=1 Tax=Linum trigynum TaxID=586398 RepID=A0AAV2DTH5_9ROSI